MSRIPALALAWAWAPLALLAAQSEPRMELSGQAILVYTRVDPIPGGGTLGEARVVQPLIMADVVMVPRRLLLRAAVDFEGWTMAGGELAPGNWGEGFVDRRHPHTYIHEAIVSAPALFGRANGPVRVGVAAGKGFVPFGSDDPMSRPVERYPVNHHLSQLLERLVAIVALEAKRATLEAALFNGDEPTGPGATPNFARFADSWAARLTLRPAPGLEWQASTAFVHSPEDRGGAGPNSRKWSSSLRADRPAGRARVYAQAEWARTSEANGVFVFSSALAEAAVTAGRHHPYYRFERTDRPEEDRTLDPFRTVRPVLDNSTLGTTRWSIHTLGYGMLVPAGRRTMDVEPFVELSLGRVATVGGGLFNPTAVYGRDTFWSGSVGLRVTRGMRGHRMGHYSGSPEMPPMAMPMRDHGS